MRVSVIVPTRNRPEGLGAAITSIQAQTRIVDEIVIVDDGSDVPVDVRDFTGVPVPTVIRHRTAQGAAAARNAGAAHATGDVLMFLDDDDEWHSEKVARQLQILEREPAVGLVYSGRLARAGHDGVDVTYTMPPSRTGDCYPTILQHNFIGTTSSVALRREVFEAVGGFDPNLPAFQDYDLWIRCCRLTRVEHDGEHSVIYTLDSGPHQISRNWRRHAAAARYMREKYRGCDGLAFGRYERRFMAERWRMVAKAARYEGLWMAIPHIVRSLLMLPDWRTVALVLPPRLVQRAAARIRH